MLIEVLTKTVVDQIEAPLVYSTFQNGDVLSVSSEDVDAI